MYLLLLLVLLGVLAYIYRTEIYIAVQTLRSKNLGAKAEDAIARADNVARDAALKAKAAIDALIAKAKSK
jgi:uncharacterized protein (UPF0333 family)